MIEIFNEVETRTSGVVYNSTFDQIKKMYEVDPEKAGELAISAIELVLTGQISSDDVMIDMMLTPTKAISLNNAQKYDARVESTKQKKAKDMKLAEIADLMKRGFKQRQIGEKLGLSQQNVSYRIGIIRTNYPELLRSEDTETAQTNFTKIQKNFTNENPLYKNTNATKSEDFVSSCNFVEDQSGEEAPKDKPKFYF